MRRLLALVISIVGVLALAWHLLLGGPERDAVVPVVSAARPVAATDAPQAAGVSAEASGQAPAAPGGATAAQTRRPPERGWLTHGQVVDVVGRPLPDFEVGIRVGASTRVSKTSAQGRFSLRGPLPGTPVTLRSDDHAVVAREHRGGIQLLVVAPAVEVSGRVQDASGEPLARAEVEAFICPSALVDFPLPGLDLRLSSWSTRSESDGTFRFPRLPTKVAGAMRFAMDEYRTQELSWPSVEGSPVVVCLVVDDAGVAVEELVRSPEEELERGELVSGTLLDRGGGPLEGWLISELAVGPPPRAAASCTTDVNGRFTLVGDVEGERLRLKAWHRRTRTTVVGGPYSVGSTGVQWIVDAQADLAVREIRVIDRGGRPVHGARVSVAPLIATGRGAWAARVSKRARTDADGLTGLQELPPGRSRLTVVAPGFAERTIDVEAPGALPAQVSLSRTCELWVQRPASESGTWFVELRDSSGSPLSVVEAFGGRAAVSRLTLSDDVPRCIRTSEDAATLIVSDDGGELFRRSVWLRPDRVSRVRL